MLRIRFFVICLSLLAALHAAAFAATYEVARRDANAGADGLADAAVWHSVPSLDGSFTFPWEDAEAPRTVFKAFHDGKTLFFSFACDDPDVVVKKEFVGERDTIDVEDRVELFFAPAPIDKPLNGKLPVYYNVEVDALGRVHDYSMAYYRARMDSSWFMPTLRVAGKPVDGGYAVEGAISLAALDGLKLLTGPDKDRILVGVFRAEFSGDPEAPETLVQRWISWVDPETAEPDYHVGSAFGVFVLLK